MRSLIKGISVAVLMTSSGFAESVITAEGYSTDSDVALEVAVEDIKSIPCDTAYMVDDITKFVKEEAGTAASGIKSVFNNEVGAHEKAQKDGIRTIDEAWDSNNKIQFRSYKVSEGLGGLLQAFATDKSAPAIDVAGFFKGIEFPPQAVASYLPEFKSLFVHQTLGNLLAIEDVLASYQRAQKNLMGRQVEIEVKFIETDQGTMNELGFDWTFESKDGGNLQLFDNLEIPGQSIFGSGLRGAAAALGGGSDAGLLGVANDAGSLQWSLVISALEQSSDSDVLSSPRVVTHNHETAMIRVGEERMIPKSFEIPNQDTSPYVQHADWDLELMGVQMEVTPEIRHDGLIDLDLNSKILDIIGYDTYQIVPDYTRFLGDSVNKGGSAYAMTKIDASLPYFRVRSLETRVTVADGNTIAMGGLIYDRLETFRDKVPLLGSIPWIGRLFRSEGERSVKRNLMIFVTATQVDVHGRKAVDLALEK